MPKISWYVRTFKVQYGDKYKNNKLMSFHIDDEKLLEKYKAIWTKIGDLKNYELNTLPVYDDRYIKAKIRTLIISIDYLLIYEKKYYLQVHLDNCAYKIINKQMTDYLDENFFED